MCTLRSSMCMILDDQIVSYAVGSRSTSNSEMELNCFLTFAFYCVDTHEGEYMGRTQHGMSVRRSCIPCLTIMKNIGRKGV